MWVKYTDWIEMTAKAKLFDAQCTPEGKIRLLKLENELLSAQANLQLDRICTFAKYAFVILIILTAVLVATRLPEVFQTLL